jgi:DNA-directed RNA polymerase delta subunit
MRNDLSMVDAAYGILKERKPDEYGFCNMGFAELMNEVAKELEMTDEERDSHLGALYTDMTLDGRFVLLKDGTWDLRSHHTYESSHVNLKDIYGDEEEEADKDQADTEDDEEYYHDLEAQNEEGKEKDEGIPSDEEEEGLGDETKGGDETLESLGIK